MIPSGTTKIQDLRAPIEKHLPGEAVSDARRWMEKADKQRNLMWMTKAECYTPELFAKQIITQGCNLCFLFWQSSLIVTGEDVNCCC